MSPYADIFKALADGTRLQILKYLNDGEEHSCSDVSGHFKLAQPTMCHHFKVLRSADLIDARKIGTTVMYSIRHKYLSENGINLDKINIPQHS